MSVLALLGPASYRQRHYQECEAKTTSGLPALLGRRALNAAIASAVRPEDGQGVENLPHKRSVAHLDDIAATENENAERDPAIRGERGDAPNPTTAIGTIMAK